MKKGVFILFLLFQFAAVPAQVVFKTIVPQKSVTAGESFQVQYIVEDAERVTGFKPPSFISFRYVSGPNVYNGVVNTPDGPKALKNTVYTLEAERPGRFTVQGATLTVLNDGKVIRSNDVVVDVISRETAAMRDREAAVNSGYFLRPGEDAQAKIRQNLFVKVMVDKKSCYVGEPVTATFKLYSRLESKSDITKNPGFYGFTVLDMVNLNDKQVATENIKGQLFDVHTIRKVQLYPLQSGLFTIDPMEVKNEVRFSKTAVNRKTEQQIVEGILGNTEPVAPGANTEVFENNMHTEAIEINVKPVPAQHKPASFNGAVGRFTIAAKLLKNELARNEEGMLELTINGYGNFIQLEAPVLEWPDGIEGFDPVVKDSLDKSLQPLTGNRLFRYPFISTRPGDYIIPAIKFSFFDPDTGNYKTVTTPPVKVAVTTEVKEQAVTTGTAGRSQGNGMKWILGAAAVVLAVFAGVAWRKRNRKAAVQPAETDTVPVKAYSTVDELLNPAQLLTGSGDKAFYTAIRQATWNFFGERLELTGSDMSRQKLSALLLNKGLSQETVTELQQVLQQCEAGMFTNADLSADRSEMLEKLRGLLEKIHQGLF